MRARLLSLEIMHASVQKAKKGNIEAAKLVFVQLYGPPIAEDILLRMERLEELAEEASNPLPLKLAPPQSLRAALHE